MKRMWATNGSITLEAGIFVPFFVILMLLLNGAFILFMGQQIVSHTLIQTAKSMALDPYLTQRVEASDVKLDDMLKDIAGMLGNGNYSTEDWYKNPAGVGKVAKERYLKSLRENAYVGDELLKQLGVQDGIKGMDFSGSTVEDGMLTLKIRYEQRYIFNAWGLGTFHREIGVKVKLFGNDYGS